MRHGGLAAGPLVGAATGGLVGAFATGYPTYLGISLGIGAGGVLGSYAVLKYERMKHLKRYKG